MLFSSLLFWVTRPNFTGLAICAAELNCRGPFGEAFEMIMKIMRLHHHVTIFFMAGLLQEYAYSNETCVRLLVDL